MPASKPLASDLRPARVNQVSAYLRQHGIAGVELRRHGYYFDFFGPPTYGWMTSSVLTDRLDSMTLAEWLAKYRELEKQNRTDPLGAKATRQKGRGGERGSKPSARAGSKRAARGISKRR